MCAYCAQEHRLDGTATLSRSVRALWWAQRAWQELHLHRGDMEGDPLGAKICSVYILVTIP